ncbi:MAG: protein kinase [Polyangiaceae bacterium]
MSQPERRHIWISACESDRRWVSRLQAHLNVFPRRSLTCGDSLGLSAGTDRVAAAKLGIEAASTIIALISADYLGDDAVRANELLLIMRRHRAGQAKLVPILVGSCAWELHPWLAHLQLRPADRAALSERDDAETILASVVREVVGALKARASGVPAAKLSNAILGALPSKQDVIPPEPVSRPPTSGVRDLERLEELLKERERRRKAKLAFNEQSSLIDTIVQRILARKRPGKGDRVAGATLVAPIGHGTFATVWRSQDAAGNLAATKVFHLEKLSQGLMLWRFRRSIKAMLHLRTRSDLPSSIIQIRSVADDELAFTMDFFPDGDLESIELRKWSIEKKIDVFAEICRAVAFSHGAGVVHRDIKPSNVLLNRSGEPTLTDFDIAEVRFATGLSVSDGGLGTPVFAAPEQLDEGNQGNEQSDVYSLGRLLYFMLIERSPGLNIEDEPNLSNLANFPPPLVAIIRRATRFKPKDRFFKVEDLLHELANHQSRAALLKALALDAWRWVRKNRSIVILVVVAIAGLSIAYLREAQHSATVAELTQGYADLKTDVDEENKKVERLLLQRADLIAELGEISRQLQVAVTEADKALLSQQLAKKTGELSGLDAELSAANKAREQLAAREDQVFAKLGQKTGVSTNARPSTVGAQKPSPSAVPSAVPTGTGRRASACVPTKGTCAETKDCCPSHNCLFNSCEPCVSVGAACTTPRDCCAGLLCDGHCKLTDTCVAHGEPCSATYGCCWPMQCDGKVCK